LITGVKQSEIAKILGISPGRVTQLKQRGMPVSSIEEAQKWYATNSKEGTGHKSGGAHPAIDAASRQMLNIPRPEVADKPLDDLAESTLWRARQTEVTCFDMLSAACDIAQKNMCADNLSIIPGLLRTHAQAARNRLEAERQWDRHRVKIGAVVSLEYAKGVVASSFGPLDAQLATLPKRAAAQANPAAPLVAERAISEAIDATRRQMDDNRFTRLNMDEIRAIYLAKSNGANICEALSPFFLKVAS
jgi:hypothetical protein